MIALIALILSLVGAINWGLKGAFNTDLVVAVSKMLFSRATGVQFTKIVYIAVGLAGVYSALVLLRTAQEESDE